MENQEIKNQLVELKNGQEIVNILAERKFLKLQEGESLDCVFQGVRPFSYVDKETGEEVTYDCAHFLAKDGNIYLSRNYKLLQIPNDLVGFPMRIVYNGEKDIKGGKRIKEFSVFTINPLNNPSKTNE